MKSNIITKLTDNQKEQIRKYWEETELKYVEFVKWGIIINNSDNAIHWGDSVIEIDCHTLSMNAYVNSGYDSPLYFSPKMLDALYKTLELLKNENK